MKKEMKKMGRRNALKSLREMMRGMEGDNMKKVTVAAPDEESLKAGLDMAKEKIGEMKDMHEGMESEEEEESEDEMETEDETEEGSELSEMSKEELIEMIKELK